MLDPGLSFGTGQHATTGFCLRELVKHRPRGGEARAFLDIGTGSGILAISAAKLGYAPVEAFDFDPEAVRVARENARSPADPGVGYTLAGNLSSRRKRRLSVARTADSGQCHAGKYRCSAECR